MEGEQGTAILVAFHAGATARWLAVLACAIDGRRKERTGERRKGRKKGMGPADGWASGAVREKGEAREGAH